MSNMYAKYTQTFHDFLIDNPTFLNNIILSTADKTNKLRNAIITEYNLYEIGGETDDMFKVMFVDTFNKWKDYYEEKITAYEKQYDYTTGNRRTTTKTSTINTEGTQDSNGSSDNKHTEIELPNKQVTSEYDGYPNAISKDESSDEGHKEYGVDTSVNDEVTTVFNDEFLDLKKKYLDQLRNIYLEFAYKFKSCFILIY